MISTQFEAESRRAQNTKVVRKRSNINPEVDSRKTGFLNPNFPRRLPCFREIEESQVFAISTQFEDESRGDQKTKVVRKRSNINLEVESRRTTQ